MSALQQHQVSGETVTRGLEGVGLFEDEHRNGMCGAQCMRVRVHDSLCTCKRYVLCVIGNSS